MSASAAPTTPRAARWLLAGSWGAALLCLLLLAVHLWEGPTLTIGAAAAAGALLSLLSLARLKRRAASPLLLLAGVGCMVLAVALRERMLQQRWQADARRTLQRANIDRFEQQVRTMIESQRTELEALKAGADQWDEATRERVRKLEDNFAAAARNAEQVIAEQRRRLEQGTAAPEEKP